MPVARLLAAVLLGKSNLAIGQADWETNNPVHGRTGNPWAERRQRSPRASPRKWPFYRAWPHGPPSHNSGGMLARRARAGHLLVPVRHQAPAVTAPGPPGRGVVRVLTPTLVGTGLFIKETSSHLCACEVHDSCLLRCAPEGRFAVHSAVLGGPLLREGKTPVAAEAALPPFKHRPSPKDDA